MSIMTQLEFELDFSHSEKELNLSQKNPDALILRAGMIRLKKIKFCLSNQQRLLRMRQLFNRRFLL